MCMWSLLARVETPHSHPLSWTAATFLVFEFCDGKQASSSEFNIARPSVESETQKNTPCSERLSLGCGYDSENEPDATRGKSQSLTRRTVLPGKSDALCMLLEDGSPF